MSFFKQATVDKLNPFLGLYETSMAFVNKQKTWFESPMGTHDPRDIEREVDASWRLVGDICISINEPLIRDF